MRITTAPRCAIADYAKRWGVETLFGILKTRGFCLESTHLQDGERLCKLLALLVIGLDWTFACDQGVLSHPLTVVIESAGKHSLDGI
jgi:hypothetical protein